MSGRPNNRRRDRKKNKNLDEGGIMHMLNQVNEMLATNPEMIKKVSDCVNNIFDNKDLMSSLVNEIQTNVGKDSDDEQEPPSKNQTLLIKDSTDSVDALE